MQTFIDFFTNLILISILEEIFVVIATLILLRMTEKIKFDKKMVISVLVPATISNFLRYFSSLDLGFIFLIFILVMVTMICLNYNQRSLIKVFIAFSCVSVACVSNSILEIANYKIIMLCTNTTEVILKEDIIYAFMSSLPIRAIESAIIILYVRKKKHTDNKSRTNMWQFILKNKELSLFATIASLFNILWIIASVKIFVFDKFLINSSLKIQTSMLILIGDIIVPIIIYICLFLSVYNIQAKEAYIDSLNKDLILARENLSKNEVQRNNLR